jgi:hypothetical protein
MLSGRGERRRPLLTVALAWYASRLLLAVVVVLVSGFVGVEGPTRRSSPATRC